MNLEKIFYIVASTVLVTVFVLIVFIFSPVSYDENLNKMEKVIYYADNISPALQKIINKFNSEYKGRIRVETIDLPFDKFSTNERKELLARYLRSKSSRIDLFSVDIIWVPRFSRWALPLNKLADSNLVEDLMPHFLPTSYTNDSLVALPLYFDIAVMFYREDMLKKVPRYQEFEKELNESITWERFRELRNLVDAANRRVNKPFYLFQADEYEGLMCSFVEVLMNKNNQINLKNGNLTKDDKIAAEAIQFLTGLVHDSKISPVEVTGMKENQSYEYFFNKEAFALRGWPGFLSTSNKAVKAEYRDKLKAAPLPHIAGSKPAFVFGGWNLMISKFSDNIPEVMRFVNFLLSVESQKLHYEEGNVLPVRRSVYEDKEFIKKHPELTFYAKLFEFGVHRPIFEDYTGLSDILVKHINNAIKNNLSAEETIAEIKKEMNLR